MEEIILEAESRVEIGRPGVKHLRDKGFIPGVVYAADKKSEAIKISHSQFVHLQHQHRLENAVISLKINDDKKQKARACLIKEIQYEPVSGEIVHLDFNEISLTKSIKVNVPVVAKGEPVGVKLEGGSLEHILWEIEIECLPTDIPKDIQVDVSQLKIGDSIHIKDIVFPENVKVLSSQDSIVLSVAAPVKEEVVAEAAIEGEEKLEPEVLKEKKVVPGEEGAEEGKGKDKEKDKKEK